MHEQQNTKIPVTGSTPLDEIRQVEGKAASQLIQAQQEARTRKLVARKQADLMIQQARLDGVQTGQADCENKISETRRQAEKVIADAQTEAALLVNQGQELVRDAVLWCVEVVAGIDGKDWRHDS